MDAQIYPWLEGVAGPSCSSIPPHPDGLLTPERPFCEAFLRTFWWSGQHGATTEPALLKTATLGPRGFEEPLVEAEMARLQWALLGSWMGWKSYLRVHLGIKGGFGIELFSQWIQYFIQPKDIWKLRLIYNVQYVIDLCTSYVLLFTCL